MNHYARQSAIERLNNALVRDGGLTDDQAAMEILEVIKRELFYYQTHDIDGRSRAGKKIAAASDLFLQGQTQIRNAIRDVLAAKEEARK